MIGLLVHLLRDIKITYRSLLVVEWWTKSVNVIVRLGKAPAHDTIPPVSRFPECFALGQTINTEISRCLRKR